MRRLKIRYLASAAVLAASLTACGGEQEQPAEGDASGEVLQGTISDDMLPLEQLQSRAPLAEPSAAVSGASSAEGDDETAPDEEEAAPVPEAAATPEE
ncbi:hypothetical protein GRI89_15065 [Altererythrobacter salegens]|uniref:Uncharacterized protein n=1 Tax=Croceibacterium salegens TaxID=1737568 RepID=A0A6I4SXX8_9SPHN|nr:hypothetical protein [Croceibacterium salegens]MXO60861.1 hypothetical protein [Croceibacterium salegens]